MGIVAILKLTETQTDARGGGGLEPKKDGVGLGAELPLVDARRGIPLDLNP